MSGEESKADSAKATVTEGCNQSDLVQRRKRIAVGQKLAMLFLGVAIPLFLSEIGLRVYFSFAKGHDPFAHNPVIKMQSDNIDLFESDSHLGHRLKGAKFIGVYTHGLISFNQIVEDSRRTGRMVVLNIGDSSTSGWDSNVVAGNAELIKNGKPAQSPFQAYKTYSDILAESPNLYIINAGVPGFSSIQGYRYLKLLLEEFKQAQVRIDLVTVYFGNNDSIYNGNIEDEYQLPDRSVFQLRLVRVFDQAISRWRIVPRVSVSDYGKYVTDMVNLCREAGAGVVLLEPIVPRVWPPGLRARNKEDELREMMTNMTGTRAGQLLMRAQALFQEGSDALGAGKDETAKLLLDQARENDYVVPRIKHDYLSMLSAVAKRERVTLVSVADSIPLRDSKFFRDYCHPDEPANKLFAAALISATRDIQPRRQ